MTFTAPIKADKRKLTSDIAFFHSKKNIARKNHLRNWTYYMMPKRFMNHQNENHGFRTIALCKKYVNKHLNISILKWTFLDRFLNFALHA